ncbi:MAG: 16S rRNA (cytosine(1402)-N(4))-methyltransferase [Bdellovibrionales bacterium CG12_big_fil_rev_8_21_14_0_65_38_15]|nr:MAG: 16S rRNA (cytosine(1402)-N(4))-methyltransferase [Bdellovibrionales bacterium CG22_combo_CG10-13_8_21_14_all_38_13]PIQ56032.1 MAG: 16S rRNA (cytosine(1402)-N(4))-methyltransferase [Bdellovibrionales bacterium CG12_big_fil_rev_8_21_14_0_65_38_15]PIR30637.1 MAG: 16S rRNA (cytosine(1402)-N(4))-methyltransferase [Bdellovibrionales bacterium CG11_big_fil_rev_8_21_14_0_20_38_13]
MSEYKSHYSVMKEDVITHLGKDNGIYADLTFGAGGHSLALAKFNGSKVLSFDQDPEALANGFTLFKEEKIENIKLVDSNFENFQTHADIFLKENNAEGFDGIVMDLGVSSHHFDEASRGFSFRFDAPLDMRMNPRAGISAAEFLNTSEEEQIAAALWEYGEEKLSRKIAKRIVHDRKTAPIESTLQLAEIVRSCYPAAKRFSKIHPATKTFQALRIEVNNELGVLSDTLPQVASKLVMNGRLAVISFHSLEDRLAKIVFKELEQRTELPLYKTSRKPIVPSPSEIFENSRSRSAKMRVLERISFKRDKNKYAHLNVKE